MLFFKNRADAGRRLAPGLTIYANQNSIVIALNPGAVIIGAQIAMQIHADLGLLLTEEIKVPGEPTAIATVTANNTFTYNNMFSTGEIEELKSEYLNYIEAQRLEKIHKLHIVMGVENELQREFLQRKNVIIVSDGLSTGQSLSVVSDFLKPVKVKRLVVVTPIASVNAVDVMHLFADEVHCLGVTENYIDTNHYYEENLVPNTEGTFKIIRNISLSWENQQPNPGSPALAAIRI